MFPSEFIFQWFLQSYYNIVNITMFPVFKWLMCHLQNKQFFTSNYIFFSSRSKKKFSSFFAIFLPKRVSANFGSFVSLWLSPVKVCLTKKKKIKTGEHSIRGNCTQGIFPLPCPLSRSISNLLSRTFMGPKTICLLTLLQRNDLFGCQNCHINWFNYNLEVY